MIQTYYIGLEQQKYNGSDQVEIAARFHFLQCIIVYLGILYFYSGVNNSSGYKWTLIEDYGAWIMLSFQKHYQIWCITVSFMVIWLH